MKSFLRCTTVLALVAASAAAAQDRGYWTAQSTTARGVTGDITIGETRVTINFNAYTLAEIRALTPSEAAAIFSTEQPGGSGLLYRVAIPGTKRFAHKNTLCGGDDVQWLATYTHGKTLAVAMFSGAMMPVMTAEALANTTSLCGTYGYSR